LKKRYFIELSYDGTDFCGWQIQPNAPSIQETLNKALSLILRQEVYVVGCGRTDTGVHASHFIAHFDALLGDFTHEFLIYKLNCLLPFSIAIHDLFQVKDDAHARFHAKSREYKYYVNIEKNPFTHMYAFKPNFIPNIEKMNEACKVLFEYIDFTSFSKLHTDAKTNNCTIMKASWEQVGNQLIFTIQADRFLRNMVRAIVGTMLEIGRDRLNIDGLRKIIESKNRCNAGVSVPGKALFLHRIKYNMKECKAII
jgi:tRNA pseudouridine38-40 synthase